MSQASPYDASVRRLRHLPQDRQCTVEPQTDDGSGQPDNDRIAAAIRKDEGFVGPPEVAEMAATERIEADLAKAMEMLPTQYDTVRHEAEYAEEHLQGCIDELSEGPKYVPIRLYTVMVAIRAIRKAVE